MVISVDDVDGAIAFYVDTLCFEKRVDVPFGGQYRWVEVAPPSADTTIALSPPPPAGSAGNRETGIGLQATDIDGLHADLKDRAFDTFAGRRARRRPLRAGAAR